MTLLKKIPFSSERKRMSTTINYFGKQIVLLKGASEIVLSSCYAMISCRDGKINKLDKDNFE